MFYPTNSKSNASGSPGGKTGSIGDNQESCSNCHYAGVGNGASITSNISGKKLYKHMSDEGAGDSFWQQVSCSPGSSSSTASHVLDEKVNKWDNRFSTRRLKCDSANAGEKTLKVYEICKGCTYNNIDILERIYFGRMRVTIKSTGTDSLGNPRKKSKFLYFQIH